MIYIKYENPCKLEDKIKAVKAVPKQRYSRQNMEKQPESIAFVKFQSFDITS